MINAYVSQVITPCFQLLLICLVAYMFIKPTNKKEEPTAPIDYATYRTHKIKEYVEYIGRINRGQRWLENYAKRIKNV